MNLFEQPNLFTMKEQQDALNQDKILATRVLRQLWLDEGFDKGMTLGEYVDSITTPEDEVADQILEYAAKKAERDVQEQEVNKSGFRVTSAQRGARALITLTAIQTNCILF